MHFKLRHFILLAIFIVVNFFVLDFENIRYWVTERPTAEQFGLPQNIDNLFLGGSYFNYAISGKYINEFGSKEVNAEWAYRSRGPAKRLSMLNDFLDSGRRCKRLFFSYYQMTERRHDLFAQFVPFSLFMKLQVNDFMPPVFIEDLRIYFDRLPYLFLKLSKIQFFKSDTQYRFRWFYNQPTNFKTLLEISQSPKGRNATRKKIFKNLKKKYRFDLNSEKNWEVTDPFPSAYERGNLILKKKNIKDIQKITASSRGEYYTKHFLETCIDNNIEVILVEPVRYPNDVNVEPDVKIFNDYMMHIPSPPDKVEAFSRLKCYTDQGHLSRYGERLYSHYLKCALDEINDLDQSLENKNIELSNREAVLDEYN